MTSITLESVSKRYENRIVFDSISVKIDSGQVYVLLGPNGSGKTTLIRLLCSLAQPSKGQISIEKNNTIKEPHDARDWIGVFSDDICLYEELTAFENIEFFSKLRNMELDILHYLDRFGLKRRAYDIIGSYSSGMKQRIKLAFSLLHEPDILLLDEPTVNLDSMGVELVEGIIEEWKENNRIVLVATNNMDEAEKLGDAFLEIQDGKIVKR